MTRNHNSHNVTAQDHEYFRQGIQRFYENRSRSTLRQAYQQTLLNFFTAGYELRDGQLVPIFLPSSELPSYNQFCYFYRQKYIIPRLKS